MLQEIFLSLYMAVGVYLSAIVCGGPFIAIVNEFRGWMWKTQFKDKFAQQIARMSIMGFWGFVFILAASFLSMFLIQGINLDKLLVNFAPGHYFPLLSLLGGMVFLCIYYLTWKRLKRRKLPHWLLGLVSVFALWLGVLGCINLIIRLLLINKLHFFADCTWTCLLLDGDNSWPILGQFILISLGGSGAMATNYLLMRRQKDDFGRDYYRSSMYLSAKWAFVFPVQLFFLIGFSYAINPSYQFLLHSSRLVPLLFALLFISLPGVFWVLLLRSENPLRNKVSLLLALLCTYLALGSMFLYYFRVLNSV